jgi:3-deoxy-D-manno-octulosonic-acid transferase
MMNHIFLSCTRVYSAAIEACGIFILPLLGATKAASQWNIKERSALPPRRETSHVRPVEWVHAASLGESKVLLKFLSILKKRHPDRAYVLTATTRAGVDYLRSKTIENAVAVGFLPLDTLRLMESMLKVFQVGRVWLMETELWPSMMLTCMRAGVPIGIVNARMEERSFRSYWRFRALVAPLFRALDIVLAQNEPYARRFERMGARPEVVHSIGNLKSLVDIARPAPHERQALRDRLNVSETSFVLTAGCIHAGEGVVLKEALAILDAGGARIKCIVVPRHLKDTPALLIELGTKALHLKEDMTQRPWDVCIVDKMGVLEDMYKVADAAFVGGTFVPIGGHNVWDAAQFALPVFFGPYYFAQQESCERIIGAGVGFSASGAGELAKQISAAIAAGPTGASALVEFMKSTRLRFNEIESLLP